jgi:hypothetical protein
VIRQADTQVMDATTIPIKSHSLEFPSKNEDYQHEGDIIELSQLMSLFI